MGEASQKAPVTLGYRCHETAARHYLGLPDCVGSLGGEGSTERGMGHAYPNFASTTLRTPQNKLQRLMGGSWNMLLLALCTKIVLLPDPGDALAQYIAKEGRRVGGALSLKIRTAGQPTRPEQRAVLRSRGWSL